MRFLEAAALASSTLTLAGCYSPSALVEKVPALSASSTKTPKIYALCVLPQWQEYRPDATMSETETGYRIISGNDMNTNEILSISKTASGSSVKFYQRAYLDFGSGKENALRSTKACL
ncbi:hypothetical protein [Pseudomonas fluorescens]|uniref:hypothetical protein n=1 Tax=Pseudomonas fluorescens TaxID=294 RepID=UPI001A9E3795|nr:hypothetical protein [Pseudomonas fluorescens]QTD33771.1 hypothetical protein JZM58_02640 [Pseudomonas fluorescens]